MNREIKFRAWDSCEHRIIYNADELNEITFNESDNGFFMGKNDSLGDWYTLEIMQYTGLKDKNGIDIFEGDLIQHDAWDYPFEIIFNQAKARFVCKMKNGLTQYIDNERLQVIGNIFENPELLK